MKILLLEDDFSLNETIKETIELYGFEVDSFYDGLSAYEHISNNYDLYILDINTPEIEGLDVLSQIKSINKQTKVIMISANIDIEKIREAYVIGCDDYIKKPFDVEEIILKIEKINNTNSAISNKKIYENISFNLNEKELYIDDSICILTKNEKYFLYLLIENIDKVITHNQIEDFVYGGNTKTYNAVRSMVKRLRKKLPADIIHNNIDEGYFIKSY